MKRRIIDLRGIGLYIGNAREGAAGGRNCWGSAERLL